MQFRIGGDRGFLFVGQPSGGVDDETAAFQGVVADGDLDLFGEYRADQGAGKLRDVDFLVLRHQGVAGERIVVFPAGQRADAADSGVHDLQAGTVALAPDHALMEGGGDFPAGEFQRAVGVEHHLGVVERAVVAFVDAEHDNHVVAAGRGGDCVGDRAGDDDGVFVETDVFLACRYRRIDEGEIRIPGDESFRKDDQVDAFPGGLGDGVQDFGYCAALGFEVGGELRGGGSYGLRHWTGPVAETLRGWPDFRPAMTVQSVQVSRMTALAFLWISTRSSTSSGLIGRMPSINDGSP